MAVRSASTPRQTVRISGRWDEGARMSARERSSRRCSKRRRAEGEVIDWVDGEKRPARKAARQEMSSSGVEEEGDESLAEVMGERRLMM